jgi:hypothetical protein
MIECIKGEYTMMQTDCASNSNFDHEKTKRQRLTKIKDLDPSQARNTFRADPGLTLQKALQLSDLEPNDASSIASLTLQKASTPLNAISNPDPLPLHPPTFFLPPNPLTIIKSIINVPCATPSPPLFKFNLNLEAAHRNYLVMRKFNNNIEQTLNAQQDSPLGYGSEFRKPSILEPLLSCHPNWKHFKRLL